MGILQNPHPELREKFYGKKLIEGKMNTFNCRNNTGRALTLLSGTQTLIVLSQGQLGQNISNAVTNVKLGGSSTTYNRKQGHFVSGNSYIATFNSNVTFTATGQPPVIFG